MPSLSQLAGVPFLDAYEEQRRYNQEQGFRNIQKASVLMELNQRMSQQQQDKQMRELLSQSGGDVEKAISTAIQSGNLAGAQKLAPILEVQRKRAEPRAAPFRTITRGTDTVNQELGPNGWVDVGSGPRFSPDANAPEIVKIQRFAATLPEGSPARQQLEARINRLSRGEGGDSAFGAGLTGRALSILTSMAPAFEAGQLTPDQERQFLAAATQYQQPTQYVDPTTGLTQQRRPELPPFVAQALKRRGQRVPTAQPSPIADPQPQPRPQPAQPTDAGDPRGQPGQTVWDLAPLTTGPVPAVAETLGRTPLVGEVIRPSQMTQARNFVPMLQRDLVRVLQNSPRFPEGERKAIESEINISPSVFDTTGAFRDRLIAIDRALQVRERNAFETAQSGRVGKEERIQAMNVLNALTKFRQSLGVPPTIKGDQDWQALPPGSSYIDPEGNVRQKAAPYGGARQNGGPVGQNTAYLVGERGPEMFVPQQPGVVVPNAAPGNFFAPSAPVGPGAGVFFTEE